MAIIYKTQKEQRTLFQATHNNLALRGGTAVTTRPAASNIAEKTAQTQLDLKSLCRRTSKIAASTRSK